VGLLLPTKPWAAKAPGQRAQGGGGGGRGSCELYKPLFFLLATCDVGPGGARSQPPGATWQGPRRTPGGAGQPVNPLFFFSSVQKQKAKAHSTRLQRDSRSRGGPFRAAAKPPAPNAACDRICRGESFAKQLGLRIHSEIFRSGLDSSPSSQASVSHRARPSSGVGPLQPQRHARQGLL
jgi:hypothetical protein